MINVLNKRKLIFVVFFCFLITLPYINSNGEITGTKIYSDIVTIGNSFVWYVDRYDVHSTTRPEAELVLEKGDKINVTIINEPNLNISTKYDFWFGINSSYVNYTLNDGYLAKSDFHLIPKPFFYGWIYPINIVNETSTYDYFELYHDLYEKSGVILTKNKLTEDYYELEGTIDSSFNKGYIYRKYDRKTGILLKYQEDIDFFNGSEIFLSGDIIFTYEEERANTISYPVNTVLFSVLVLYICIIKDKKRKGNRKYQK